MFKRTFILFFALMFSVVLVACNNSDTKKTTEEQTTTQVIDGPVISLAEGNSLTFETGDLEPDWLTFVTVTDDEDGNITVTNEMVDKTNVDMNTIGTFDVTYTVSDSDNKQTVKVFTITITEKQEVAFGNCDPNFPDGETYADFNGGTVRLGTWMRNFLDPFYKYAKNTELNQQKKLCTTRTQDSFNGDVEWVPYFNQLEHPQEILQNHIDGNHKADFYNINSHYLGMLAEAGAIKPLDDYLEYLPEYYYNINLEMGTWKGHVYGIWNDRNNVNNGIYVNLDLIAEYSQTNPAELWQDGEWNWEAFSQMAAEIKASAPSNIEIFGIDNYNLTSFLIGSNGGNIIDPATDEFSLLQPKSVHAMEYVQDITSKGYTWFADDGLDATTRVKFTSGELVFYFGADWISGDCSILKPGDSCAVQSFDLGMVPFPVGPDVTDIESEYRLPVTVGNLWVMRGDATDEEAEKLMQYWSHMQVWMDDDEQDDKYYLTMEDHMDDLTSLEAYTSVSRYGYFEKTFLYGIAWDPDGGLGGMFGEIAEGASITGTIEAKIPILRAKIDEALGE